MSHAIPSTSSQPGTRRTTRPRRPVSSLAGDDQAEALGALRDREPDLVLPSMQIRRFSRRYEGWEPGSTGPRR